VLYRQIGQRAEARAALPAAIALYCTIDMTLDMTFWLPQTEAVLAQVEGQ